MTETREAVPSGVATGSASDRLHALGLTLPGLTGGSMYVNHRTPDSSIHIAGQLPYEDGELLGQGIVGRDVDVQTARELARHAARTAIDVAGLPRNSPVEIQMVCTAV